MVALALKNRGLLPNNYGTPTVPLRTSPYSTNTTPRSYSAMNIGGSPVGSAANPGGQYSALNVMGANPGGMGMSMGAANPGGMSMGANNPGGQYSALSAMKPNAPGGNQSYAKPAFKTSQNKPNVPPNQLGQNLLDFATSGGGQAFARGLLEASGYSTTPVSFGQAVAQGMAYMNEADQTEASRKQQEFENKLLERQLEIQEKEALAAGETFKQGFLEVPDGKGGTIKQPVNISSTGKMTSIGGSGGTNININDGTSKGYEKVNEKYAAEYIKWIDTGAYQVELENLSKLDESLETLENENVTGAIIGLTPNAVLSVLNPEALNLQDNIRSIVFQGLRATLGAQFTEREGNRLVEAAFNPLLSEEMNIVRLKRMRERIKTMIESKQSAVNYFQNNNGSMQGYTGRATFNLDDAINQDNQSAINNGKDEFLSSIYQVSDYKDISDEKLVEYFQNAQPEEQTFIIENAEAIGLDLN